jgi:hypothetical protein
MQLKESHISTLIVLIGWLVSAVWFFASMSTKIEAIQDDITKLETKTDQIMWWLQDNVGPTPPASTK